MALLKFIFPLLAYLMLCGQASYAQQKTTPKPPVPAGKDSFIIKKTALNKDSVVTVDLELFGNVQPMREDFKLTNVADGTAIDIQQIAPAGTDDHASTSTRLIYFLIDASNYTEGMALKYFKSAVKSALGGLSEGDLVNVGYFSTMEDVISLNREFGTNIADLGSDIETRITAHTDSAGKSDAFKAAWDAIDILKNTNKEGQRILIILSGGIKSNNPEFSTDNVASYARKNNVTIHTVSYKIDNVKAGSLFAFDSFRVLSSKTEGGLAIAAKTSTDIKNALGNFLERRMSTKKDENVFYTLTFLPTVHDGAEHKFKLAYAGTELQGSYIAPSGKGGGMGGVLSFLMNQWVWLVIVLLLLAGFGYWQLNEARLRRIEREEEELQQQEEIERARLAEIAKREKQQDAVIQELRNQTSRLEDQMRQKEQEFMQRADDLKAQMQFTPTVVPPNKFDMKNTIISGGGGSPVLLVSAGSYSNNFYLNKPTMNIGRAANNDIVIPEQTVSNHHARITIENGSFFLLDLGSTNGTFVNGTRVDRKLLKAGDIVKFGASNCRFEI